jgi:hypothetical protein
VHDLRPCFDPFIENRSRLGTAKRSTPTFASFDQTPGPTNIPRPVEETSSRRCCWRAWAHATSRAWSTSISRRTSSHRSTTSSRFAGPALKLAANKLINFAPNFQSRIPGVGLRFRGTACVRAKREICIAQRMRGSLSPVLSSITAGTWAEVLGHSVE